MRLSKVYKRDKGICYICKKPVSKWAASRDHVYPRAMGGTAGRNSRNIKLAHKGCNLKKADKVLRKGVTSR